MILLKEGDHIGVFYGECIYKNPCLLITKIMPAANNQSNTSTWSKQTKKSRWFIYLNVIIAIVVLSAVILLKDSNSHYQDRSAYDTAYVKLSGEEKDPKVLHHGIVYTEAARANAYHSITMQSHGTFFIGLLVSLVFMANSIFIFRSAAPQRVNVVE